MALRFNPPPGWPAPPEGFLPAPGWQPDPSWPPPPEGWQLWVPADVPEDLTAAGDGVGRPSAETGDEPLRPSANAADGPPPAAASAGYGLPAGAALTAYGQSGSGSAGPAELPSGYRAMAIAAFVLGLLGFLVITAILGVVLGAVALRGIRRSLQGRGTLAILGIVFGGLWLVGLVALIGIGAAVGATFTVWSSSSPPALAGQRVVITSLVTGDCFDFPTSSAAQGVAVVEQTSCSQPHNSEVVATFRVSGSQPSYPGVTRLSAQAVRGCAAAVKGKLDTATLTSTMTGRFLYPLAGSWQAGDRTIDCIIYSPTSTSSSVLKH